LILRASHPLIVAALILACPLSGIAYFLSQDPDTAALDADLKILSVELKSAIDTDQLYEAGLIKTYTSARVEVLRLAEAALFAKRLTMFRRINLVYANDGKLIWSEDLSKSEYVSKSLADAERAIQDAEREADKYSGGIAKGLALVQVETARLIKSQVLINYFAAMHGVGIPAAKAPPVAAQQAHPIGQETVADREAL
jgi:hypothetical protein